MPYSMRKIRGKDMYRVINSETGEVKSSGSTKKDAKAQLRLLRGLEKKGGSLQADQIKQVIENSYKDETTVPSGYTLDQELSDNRVKVYKDMNSDQVIVAHRGSQGWRDWFDNARYAYSGDIKPSGTYKEHKAKQQKAIDKYGAKNVISVGHSRAGKYVEELNKEQPVKEVITYNKAVAPQDAFQSNPENQTDIRTSTDVVSALSPFQSSKNKIVTIPTSWNLLKAHGTNALSSLGNKLLGKGYKQMRVADMRKFVKAYKKAKYGEKMIGGAKIGKKELVGMLKPILEDDDLDELVGGSVWTDFVKEFSAKHGLKYACALSKWKEPLKKAYKLKKENKNWFEPMTGEKGTETIKKTEVKFEPMEEAIMDTSPKSKNITIVKPKKSKTKPPKVKRPEQLTEDQFVEAYDTPAISNAYYQYYPRGATSLEKLIAKTIDKDGYIDIDLLLSKGVQLPISTVRKLVLTYGLIPTFAYTKQLLDDIGSGFMGTLNTTYSDTIDTIITYSRTLKAIGKLSKEEMEKAKKGMKEKEPEPAEMIEMEYRPKLTREMRRALELELASKPSRLSQLPPIRGEREEELMELPLDELKDIVGDNNIKTKKKTKQALIDAILLHEGEVKGTVLPEEQYNDLVELHNILKLKNTKGNRSLSALYQNLGTQKNKLKEMRQEKNRDLFAERLQMDRISNMEDYIKFAEKLLLKDVLKGKGVLEGGNKWTDFVKDYAQKDNTTYGCALSDPGTSTAYKLFKDGKPWYFPRAKEMETQTEFVEPKPTPAPTNIEPVVSRIEEKVKELEKIGREKGATAYDGTVAHLSIAFVQLMKKYSSKCIVVNVNKTRGYVNVGVDINTNPTLSNIIPKRLGASLKKCVDNGVDMIVMPLGLEWEKLPIGHANMLIYRPLQKQVERFEPHGSMFSSKEPSWDKSFNDQLKQLFEVDLKPFIGDVRYREPVTICPSADGFQNLESSIKGLKEEGGGFCGLWSIFLAEMTMLNPTKSTKEIIDEVMDITKREPAYLKSIIRGYVRQVETGLDELIKTLGKSGFKYGDKKKTDTVLSLKTKLNEWILETMFEVPDPVLIQSYKDKLKFMTKKEVNQIYDIYAQNRCIKKVDVCIDNLLDLLSRGVLYPFGATGLKDIDVILRDKLYDENLRKLPEENKYSVYGLGLKGYFYNN